MMNPIYFDIHVYYTAVFAVSYARAGMISWHEPGKLFVINLHDVSRISLQQTAMKLLVLILLISSCYVAAVDWPQLPFKRDLKAGDRGVDVKILQGLLERSPFVKVISMTAAYDANTV